MRIVDAVRRQNSLAVDEKDASGAEQGPQVGDCGPGSLGGQADAKRRRREVGGPQHPVRRALVCRTECSVAPQAVPENDDDGADHNHRGDPEADVLHRHPRPHAEDFLPEV